MRFLCKTAAVDFCWPARKTSSILKPTQRGKHYDPICCQLRGLVNLGLHETRPPDTEGTWAAQPATVQPIATPTREQKDTKDSDLSQRSQIHVSSKGGE
jgi:hypothetical protein